MMCHNKEKYTTKQREFEVTYIKVDSCCLDVFVLGKVVECLHTSLSVPVVSIPTFTQLKRVTRKGNQNPHENMMCGSYH